MFDNYSNSVLPGRPSVVLRGRLTRRALIAAFARTAATLSVGGLVAGCTPNEDDPRANASDTDADDPQDQANPGARVVEHAMGSTEVPAKPERVVVLEEGPLNSALSIGITPVGAVTAFEGEDFPAYLGDRTAGIQNVGTILEPDLEAVAALEPDLILSIKSRHEEIYSRLSQIAPTVFTETFRCCWRENFLKDAEALGKPEEGERIIDDYWQRLEEFKAEMGDRLSETEVSVVRFVPPGDVYIYQKASYIGTILEDAGLPRPPSQDVDDFVLELSQEQIREMDGDVIFVTTYGPPDETQLEEFRSDPLWKQLEAVQHGSVYTVPDDYWMVGIGIIAANKVIDDLFTYLVDGDAESVSPKAFPQTIQHKFGTTEIAEEPQRVIALGYKEQDPILALGVKPIAVRYWFADEPYAVFPWAQEQLGDAEPEVLEFSSGEVDFEAIAALEPDLIIGLYSGITEDEYETLSRIAPTIAPSGDYIDYGMPWQEMTVVIGRALSRESQARDLVSNVEGEFEEARNAHPNWGEKQVVIGYPTGDGQFSFVASQDARSRIFENLGFEVPSVLDDIAGDEFWGTISLERADLLDVDLLVFHQMQWVEGGRETIESDPLLSQLDVVNDGRVLYVEGEVDDALQFGTVLSLPFLLEELVPMIEAVLDGPQAS